MRELVSVILAAGTGAGVNSQEAKVIHRICGEPMLSFAADAAKQAGSGETIVVLGPQAQKLREFAGNGACILQADRPGTVQALMQAREHLSGRKGTVLVISDDTPAITSVTLKAAYEHHLQNKNHVTAITAKLKDQINSGICFFEIDTLLNTLDKLSGQNPQNWVYLSDIITGLIHENLKAGTFEASDPQEVICVNDRIRLAEAEKAINSEIIRKHMLKGVTFVLPETSLVGPKVQIGAGTVVMPGTILDGETIIGESCSIGPNSRISRSSVGNNTVVMNSVVLDSKIGSGTKVGPFAYLRPECKIGDNVKIGDFVEVKKSEIKDNSKVSHLTYIGDAEIGKNVNVGCGVVVVNYDGVKKHRTVVGDNAFIGCNVNLVSPVEVKDHAFIAAGSTITEEVPEYALAIARSRQTIVADWVRKKRPDKE